MPQAPSAQQQPLIQAQNLVKHYGSMAAVRDISFRVHRGEVVGFLGPNGAGKSTTMKMLTGFLRPTQGRASIMGIDMAQHAKLAQRHIGYLPENAPLYDEMMVIDFLRFIGEVRGIAKAKLGPSLRDAVMRCGLGDVLGKDIGTLSKGFRQRVGLAQALLSDPDLLILDEPTSGLDPNQIVEIRALIRDLGKDKTVLLSTHILSEVQAVCSRAIIINQGTIVADATPEALGAGDGGMVVQATLRGRQGSAVALDVLREQLERIPGVSQVRAGIPGPDGSADFEIRGSSTQSIDLREAIFEVAVAQNCCLLNLHRQQVSLEETFQRLTGAQSNTQGVKHAA